MRTLLLCFCFLFPLCTFAYTSVIAIPENAREVLPIADAAEAQEFFGRLDGYPHTFEFVVPEAHEFSASLFVHDNPVQENDASLIIIKEEMRGVSEVGRTKGRSEAWRAVHDPLFAETWRDGGTLASALQPGVYRAEVSSPDNIGAYRLVLGNEKIERSYFDNLRALFEIKLLLHASVLGTVLSPLVYYPLGALLLAAGVFLFQRNRKRFTL